MVSDEDEGRGRARLSVECDDGFVRTCTVEGTEEDDVLDSTEQTQQEETREDRRSNVDD